MSMREAAVAVYFIFISILSVSITVWDKHASKISGKRRVPEKTLLIVSAAGGGISMLFTMLIIRHKTKHPKFMLGIPVILIAEYGVFLTIYNAVRR